MGFEAPTLLRMATAAVALTCASVAPASSDRKSEVQPTAVSGPLSRLRCRKARCPPPASCVARSRSEKRGCRHLAQRYAIRGAASSASSAPSAPYTPSTPFAPSIPFASFAPSAVGGASSS